MRRLALFAALGLACAGLACRAPQKERQAPLNVIFILLDTLRADHLSAYGYGKETTPSLAAFAREGVLFEQARSQAACTFPSVNSILTSRWPAVFLGQPGGRMGIPEGIAALPEILGGRGYRTIAVSASPIVRRSPSQHNAHGGFARGFELFDETCFHRRADCVNRRARRYLNHVSEPLFLYLHYMDAHSVYEPPSPYRERFVEPYPEGRSWVVEGNLRPLQLSLAGKGPHVEVSARDMSFLRGLYDGEIAYLDSQLGALFADLEARGLFERSIVIVAADHGEEFMEHGRIFHCELLFDSSIHVPLLVRAPGLERRGRISALVQNLDIAPTILDYLGLAADPKFEGVSLRPLIARQTPLHDSSEALQYALRSVTDGRAKLVFDQKSRRFQLFDLVADPLELKDVLPRNRPVYARLRGRLETWLAQVEGGLAAAGSVEKARESERQLKALGYLQ